MVTTPLESKENCRSTTTSPVGIFFNYGVVELTFQLIENLLLKSINFVVSEFVISTGSRKLKIYIFLFLSVFPLTTRHARAQIMSRQLLIAIPGIDPSHVGCVLDSVVLGEVSLRVHPPSTVKDFPAVLHTHFLICYLYYIISGGNNIVTWYVFDNLTTKEISNCFISLATLNKSSSQVSSLEKSWV
jgi:hypothetical protein